MLHFPEVLSRFNLDWENRVLMDEWFCVGAMGNLLYTFTLHKQGKIDLKSYL